MSFRGPGVRHAVCVVCGEPDARALCTTRLASGETVIVCGTHELMHRRARAAARDVEHLALLVRDRRDRSRRRPPVTDELAEQLSAAFRSERRRSDRRA